MELHAPDAVAEPERLRARRAPCELDRACGHAVGVVVPLEGVEALRERAEDGILARGVGQLDLVPADLGLVGAVHGRVRRFREQLRAEAHAEGRHVEVEQPLEEEVLVAEPGVALLLVGVHCASEDEHCVVRVDGTRRRSAPGERPLVVRVPRVLDDAREQFGPRVCTVDHRQHIHVLTVAGVVTGTPSASSSLRSASAFAAPCGII